MEMSINGARYLAEFQLPVLGTVHLTQTVVVSWLVMAIITGLCIWLGSGLKVTGISRKQVVVPGSQYRQLQFQCGDFHITNVIVTVQVNHGKLRWEGRLGLGFVRGDVSRAVRTCLTADHGFHI